MTLVAEECEQSLKQADGGFLEADQEVMQRYDEVTLRALYRFDEEIRNITDEKSLFFHLCNESKEVCGYQQAFVFVRKGIARDKMVLSNATSLSALNQDAPMHRWLEKLVSRLEVRYDLKSQLQFSLPAFCDPQDDEARNYPFPHFLWTPLPGFGEVRVGLLKAKGQPWLKREVLLCERCAKVYAHALRACRAGKSVKMPKGRKRLIWAGFLGVIVGMSLLPVPITSLAPAEVTAVDPDIVAAPLDGVVAEILVEPGQRVQAGDALIAFEDLEFRNRLEVARQQEAVALARLSAIQQGAIADARNKHELAIARAEHKLAVTRREFAAERLAQTILRAKGNGLAVFTDKRDWVGRPVAAGEAILQIANPERVHFSIDLPVKESLSLREGASVKVFLDSAPLEPIDAILTQAGYRARIDRRNVLSYRLQADFSSNENQPPRLGIQGTAQIYGEKTWLIFALFRRPLASFRLFLGL